MRGEDAPHSKAKTPRITKYMAIDGEPCLLTQGMYYVIPSDVPHTVEAKTYCKVIDAFCPVREDYKT